MVRKMTNWEYIRSLSDEEFARMMRNVDPEEIGIPFCNVICPHRGKDCGGDEEADEIGECNYFRGVSAKEGNARIWLYWLQMIRE